MKLPALLATLTEEPLLITPAAHAALLKLFTDHATLDAETFKAIREGTDICGEDVEIDQAELQDGVTIIPVGGPIGRGLGKFEKGAGAVDVDDIHDEIDAAEDDPDCHSIMFNIDSPGGMFSGTPELGDRIMACQKNTAAFIGGLGCSAAYWLASSCDIVMASRSADVANVGVYCYLLDNSKRYEALGIKPEVISSGKYKGMGAPGVPLTKDQRAHLQDRINEMAEMFYRHVEDTRGDVSREDMQGQAFKAETALSKGFIDHIVPNLSAALAFMR